MADLIRELTLTHLGIGDSTSMPVLVSLYQQDAKPNFSSTSVYARMDPIFTYQNTVRTFSVTCQTLTNTRYKEYWTPLTGSNRDAEARVGLLLADDDELLRGEYGAFISDIYRMMYPVYERTVENGIPTNTLKSPPILSLKINAIIGQSEAVIFVPESFVVNTGFADRSEINVVVESGADLRYLAAAGGYGFTLGGTILHKDEPPGFISVSGSTGTTISFSKENFPIGAGTRIEILKP